MIKWIACVIAGIVVFAWLAFRVFLGPFSILEKDETLIAMVNEHGKDLAPIAKIIWEHGHDSRSIIDLRSGGDHIMPSGRKVRIEPPSLINKITDEQIEMLADADIRLVSEHGFYGGVLFITGENGIGNAGAVTGLIWKGDQFNPELVVPNLQGAVEKERASQNKRKDFEFIRPVNDEWGIFYEDH